MASLRLASLCPGCVGEVLLEASISRATRCTRFFMSAITVSRLFNLVTFCPVVFYMLDKFAVPGGLRLVTVAPVYDELGHE